MILNMSLILQGDEPMINIDDIKNLKKCAIESKSELATLACKINNKEIFKKKNIVKVITENEISNKK